MNEMLHMKTLKALEGLKNGTETPQNVMVWLNRLKPVNPFLYEDYFEWYKQLVPKTN